MNGVDSVPADDHDAALRTRLDEERVRLRTEAGLPEVRHFRRPAERPFLAGERAAVTILIGGLTIRHDVLIQAVFQGCGYRCERLPVPDVAACQVGKEFGNVGQCNPAYFTIGALIAYLRRLEAQGLTRQQIIEQYVFFTAGSCGPCRFGMYETEYRYALENAGYAGFRVLIFQQTDGISAAGEPGLKFTINFGMGMLNALLLADVLNDLVHQIRPFEVIPGATDRAAADVLEDMARFLRERRVIELMDDGPGWLTRRLATRPTLKNVLSVLCKIYEHVYGRAFRRQLRAWRASLDAVEVDRLRVKPIVKITGEFWAQTTEGDGNFRMFEFLEREGAQVVTEPIATWLTYMIHLERLASASRRAVEGPYPHAAWWRPHWRAANAMKFQRKNVLLGLGEGLLTHFHRRLGVRLGGRAHRLVPQSELARLAHPYYHQLARGGEGSMEVGKNVYYSLNRLCHMVLALKPFGCMPSSQSDGVQSAVTSHFRDMIFLPVETAGEGEINAHSRVQMSLADARARARAEFDDAIAASGRSVECINAYVARHGELRRPFHPIPRRPGVTGTAAQFVYHVSSLMDAEAANEARRASLVGNPTW
jgi:predicted nucleotide-binding protein (sugar kinase/HSP70/actin superfamily)